MGMGPTLALAALISAAVQTPQGDDRALWLCESARRVLGVDGVSLSLMRRVSGSRGLLAATDATSAAMEAADDVLGTGPTHLAAAGTRVVLRTSATAPPWSALVTLFSGTAAPSWVVAVAVHDGTEEFGTLLVHTEHPALVQDTAWISDVAEAVVVMLTAQAAEVWLEPALAAGDSTNRAVGVLMAEHRTSATTALDLLRSRAFSAGTRLADAAHLVLDTPRDNH
ncbi:ANTAR domain-containing protein [Cellulomonas hominis]|jgi:hypothetical protein|nr:ANTAR domain-containing protein [Cellulomonas hominis]